jgi:hypothetical protein
MLGKSIKALSKADIVYLVNGWDTTRGCLIERAISRAYEVPEVIEEVLDEDGNVKINTYITNTFED